MDKDESERGTARDWSLPISIIIAGVLVAGAVIYATGLKNQPAALTGTPPAPSPAREGEAPPIGDAVILGDPNAPVTMIEYGDFQCPYCGRFFTQTEPLIIERYVKTGKVKFVYKDFVVLGPESFAAAEAAKCAADQGKFWDYHDALYREEQRDGREHNGNLNRALFLRLAGELGMESQEFASCVDARTYQSAVEADVEEAKAYGVEGTPAIFVGSRFVAGALPFALFEEAIEAELNK